MRARFSAVFVLAILFAVLPTTAAFAQPDNDDFEAAAPVAGLPFEDVVDVADATVQPDEPTEVCAPMGNTVWYGLTLEAPTDVTVNTADSDYDTVLAVWTGTDLLELELVDCVDDTFSGLQAAVTFSAQAGVTYWVQAAAFGEAFEGSTLHISFAEPGKATGKPTIQKFNFRGLSASAFSESFDEGGAMFANVQLQEAREKEFQGRPFGGASVFVSFAESFDEGEGTFTFTDWFGFAELEGSEYSLNRKLNSAYVATNVTMFGFSCTEGPHEEVEDGFGFETECVELGPVDVWLDVAWDGIGGVFQNRFMSRSSGDSFRSNFSARSTSRQASVEGGFAGDGLAFDFSGAEGFMSRDSFAEMVVFRGDGFMIF